MTQWNTLQQYTKIPRKQFLSILQFCLNDNNYFVQVSVEDDDLDEDMNDIL